MGCPLGSFGFDLALQAVVERCVARVQRRHRTIVVSSLTDDVNLAVQLPSDPVEADVTLRRQRPSDCHWPGVQGARPGVHCEVFARVSE